MNKKYENRSVDLLDLFWNIVFAWRMVLAWMLVLALLMTGYAGLKYDTDMKNYDAEMVEYKAALNGEDTRKKEETTDAEFTEEQLVQIQDAVALKRQVERTRSYVDDSILMNIDPYSENILSINLYVDNGYTFNYMEDNKKDFTYSLIDAYVDYVNSGELAQTLSEQLELDTDVKYIQELLSATVGIHGEAANSFTVQLIYKDDSIFDEAARLIEENLKSQTKHISSKIGEHTLDMVSTAKAVKSDTDTAAFQANMLGNLNSYRSQYSTMITSMDEQQLAKVDEEIANSELGQGEDDNNSPERTLLEPVRPSFSVKYSILGLMMGLFLACVWIALNQILSNKLQHAQELNVFFNLNQIGVLHSSQDKKKNGLDRFLRKLRYRNRKEMDADTRLGIVCGNLELICRREKLTRICLTGSEIDKIVKTDKAMLDMLVNRLADAGIQVLPVDNICYDMTAMRKVSEVGAVALIEQVQQSIYQEIDRELMMLQQSEISVIGAIGMEE